MEGNSKGGVRSKAYAGQVDSEKGKDKLFSSWLVMTCHKLVQGVDGGEGWMTASLQAEISAHSETVENQLDGQMNMDGGREVP